MLNLVIGAAASGKSEYAERAVMALPGQRIYVATMEPFGREAELRIARHRALREGKGFRTIERPLDLAGLCPDADWNVLIEDLPNLAANECFNPSGGGAEAVLAGLARLRRTAFCVTVVTGDIFSDGMNYDTETRGYMKMLAELHRRLAETADNVTEVVCGIPYEVGVLPDAESTCETLCGTEDFHTFAGEDKEKDEIKAGVIMENRGLIYVTGPAASGKREYVLRSLHIPEDDAVFEVQELIRENPGQDMEGLVERLSAFCAVTQTEVGAGVIPLSQADREWREKAGRLACLLAARADIVVRMVCGIPLRIR